MRIVSKSINTNNSRATIEFKQNGILSNAENIANKYGCDFSHNVRIEPGKNRPKSFGTISFNRGEHASALNEFIK
jgi:hypothetical protein